MRHEDLIALRRRLDALHARSIEVKIGEPNLRYLSGLPGANHDVLDWFHDHGFNTSGITENPKTVWMGLQNSNHWDGGIVVCFHPDAREDAMLFKLTFG